MASLLNWACLCFFASFASVPRIIEGAEGEEGTITEDDELLQHCAAVPCNGVPDKSTLPRKEEAEKAPSEGGLLPLSLLKDYRSIMLETNSPTLT